MNYLQQFSVFIKGLSELKKSIEPFAKKANISTDEALVLLAVFHSENEEICFNEKLVNTLIEKQLLEYNDKRLCLTGKGSIITKSLTSNLNRL
ncbi:MAG: hypothetical protein IKY45_00775 [Clostridia bacterium]|nr:hypothetical protein [Clostridia bacterium]MBR4972978.1 hypothetical protein [Clostridia bacterium]